MIISVDGGYNKFSKIGSFLSNTEQFMFYADFCRPERNSKKCCTCPSWDCLLPTIKCLNQVTQSSAKIKENQNSLSKKLTNIGKTVSFYSLHNQWFWSKTASKRMCFHSDALLKALFFSRLCTFCTTDTISLSSDSLVVDGNWPIFQLVLLNLLDWQVLLL